MKTRWVVALEENGRWEDYELCSSEAEARAKAEEWQSDEMFGDLGGGLIVVYRLEPQEMHVQEWKVTRYVPARDDVDENRPI